MSLDVHLELDSHCGERRQAIFVRLGGQTKEITRAEWDAMHPLEEPCTVLVGGGEEVYSDNITHNLNRMADAAGLYSVLWRPDEIGVKVARELIPYLELGLFTLVDHPDKFKEMNPSNGWGDYDGLVGFVTRYFRACQKHPEALVRVSR